MKPLEFRLDDKVALVTGAGRGIGLSMARVLASAGAAVAIQDIEPDVARVEVDKINVQGGRAFALGGDLTDLESPARMVDAVKQHFGPPSILINNASIQVEKKYPEQSVEEIRRQFDCNLLAPLLLARLVVPAMKTTRWGRIINVGSIQQRRGNPQMLPYSATKAALVNFTTGLAADLASHGITVNLIAPGWFNTFRNRRRLPDAEAVNNAGKNIPMQRLGQPADCDGVTLLLCSDHAAYITGQSIHVCGGMSV